MEISMEMKIAARGWHVYGKIVRQSPRKGEKLTTEKERNKEAFDIDSSNLPIHLVFFYAWWKNGGKCIIYSTITIPDPKRRKVMLKAKLTIDEKHAQILTYLQQLIVENYKPNTDIETDTESDITIQRLQEEENDVDEVIFIDDDTNNEE